MGLSLLHNKSPTPLKNTLYQVPIRNRIVSIELQFLDNFYKTNTNYKAK